MAPVFETQSRRASSGVRMSSRFTCRFSSFPWSKFPQFFCVARQEDERTGNVSKIENFCLVFSIQPPKLKWHRNSGTEVVLSGGMGGKNMLHKEKPRRSPVLVSMGFFALPSQLSRAPKSQTVKFFASLRMSSSLTTVGTLSDSEEHLVRERRNVLFVESERIKRAE